MPETLASNWRPKGNNSFTSIENVFPECRVAVAYTVFTESLFETYRFQVSCCSCMQKFKMVSLNTTKIDVQHIIGRHLFLRL